MSVMVSQVERLFNSLFQANRKETITAPHYGIPSKHISFNFFKGIQKVKDETTTFFFMQHRNDFLNKEILLKYLETMLVYVNKPRCVLNQWTFDL